jgi:hypothetical protein
VRPGKSARVETAEWRIADGAAGAFVDERVGCTSAWDGLAGPRSSSSGERHGRSMCKSAGADRRDDRVVLKRQS